MELSYSFHLGSDRNKRINAKQRARTNASGTTSLSNNAIQNLNDLSKVDKHNLRKYDNDQESIKIIKGTNNIVEDTKQLYKDLFNESLNNYNEKQTRSDRKIDDYFDHISNDKEHDLACEIIIELGDMDYWVDKSDKERQQMNKVFEEQIEALEIIIPNFKIANATAHYDEASPHLHIIGVAYKVNCKRGLEKQVGKSTTFTKESLTMIQDKMRDNCIMAFNKVYNKNYTLKLKEEGRNQDINVKNMGNYSNIKKEQEKYKKKLNELNSKTDKLQNESVKITNIIDELKPSKLNKDNLIISTKQVDEIKKYINNTKKTTSNLKDSNDLISILDKYENDLKTHSNEIDILYEQVKNRNKEIDNLKNQLYQKEDYIDELEDKVKKLEELVNFFKNLWNKLLKFFKDKFFNSNKYDDLIDDLYEEDIFDESDIEKVKGNEDIEKDDFEI